jgi:hypothetical protein
MECNDPVYCGPGYQTYRREEMEESDVKWGRVEEAFKGSHGPRRAAGTMMIFLCDLYHMKC